MKVTQFAHDLSSFIDSDKQTTKFLAIFNPQ